MDDKAVHEMPQGMVTSATFVTGASGTLRLYAADSIGIWLDKCAAPEDTPTVPAAPTITPTGTVSPSLTPTSTEEPTPAGEETPEPPLVTEEPTPSPTPASSLRG